MSATYKSRFNEEQLRTLCDVLLTPFINGNIKPQVIEDILDCLEVNNLDKPTVTKIINKWNEKVK